VATDFLRQFREGLKRCGVLDKTQTAPKQTSDLRKLLDDKQKFVEDIFTEENLAMRSGQKS